MVKLKIDPEFQNIKPPLTDGEFQLLRYNILKSGKVYSPIVVWNGVILDGHYRWKIILEHPEIEYEIEEMDFPDKDAALIWIIKEELGRRSVSEAHRDYLLGKFYKLQKESVMVQSNGKAKD